MGKAEKSFSLVIVMFENWKTIKNSTIFKLIITAAVSFVLCELAVFLLPVLLSIALAFALYPVVNLLSKVRIGAGYIRLSEAVRIIIAIVGFLLAVFLVVKFLLFPLFAQANSLFQKLPAAARSGSSIDSILNNSANLIKLPSDLNMLLTDIINGAMIFVVDIIGTLFTSSMNIIRSILGLVIVPFLAFYFLKDWRELKEMIINFFNYDVQEKVEAVIKEIGDTLSAYVKGLGLLSIISGCCITFGTFLLGVNYPLVLGFIAILAETIPVIGPLLGAVPAIFIAYGQSSNLAFWVAAFYFIYYHIDTNFIMPRIMRKRIDLHPVILILALLIGAKLFGILGMLFAVPVAAIYRVLYKELWHIGERKSV
ncbi:MAG: AI-2E family transporter [Phascolarctobacterium sp.]|nr:AI-2E family transporter [Phascolarctobacterium sp.]